MTSARGSKSRNEHSVRLLRIAEDDLTEIITYVAEDRRAAAFALADAFENHLALLDANPHLGRIPKEKDLETLGYRYLATENYLLFYTIEGRTIFVHRIVHGAREYRGLV